MPLAEEMLRITPLVLRNKTELAFDPLFENIIMSTTLKFKFSLNQGNSKA